MPAIIQKKKWTGTEVKDRKDRGARLRAARRDSKPRLVLVGELAVVRECVSNDNLRAEPELMESRWLTYSYMSVLQCTERFAKLYLDAYKRHYASMRDYIEASRKKPIHDSLFQNSNREITSLWRARQEADRLGMPYETFLDAAMGWAANQRNRRQLLAPNQLYGAGALNAANERWEQERDLVSLFTDEWDSRLFEGDEKSGRPRVKAMQLLYRRVSKSINPDIALANFMGRLGALDETLARRMFHRTPGLVDDALTHVHSVASAHGTTYRTPNVPGCFGLNLDAMSDSLSPCATCSLSISCHTIWQLTSDKLSEMMGSTDPVADKKRMQNTLRKQRQRERERNASLASLESPGT